MHTLILTVLAFASLIPAQSTSNCTVFTWNNQPAYLTHEPPQRISAAQTCPSASNSSHECPLTAAGDLDISFRVNLTAPFFNSVWNTPTGPESFLHLLILNSVNSSLAGTPWNDSVIGAIDTTQTLSPGTSGYVSFSPLKRCFVGTMSDCTGELEDGLGIEACAPVSHVLPGGGQQEILDGNFSVVEVPAGNVSALTDPFRGETRVGEGKGASMSVQIGMVLCAFGVSAFATLF